jgi:hypothetical protein
MNYCFNCGAEQSNTDVECHECGECGVGYEIVSKVIAGDSALKSENERLREVNKEMRKCLEWVSVCGYVEMERMAKFVLDSSYNADEITDNARKYGCQE